MSANFYAKPTYMSGGAFTIYSGSRRQIGGGFLGSIRKAMAPIGRTALQGLKTIARNKTVRGIAKQAAKRGADVLANVAVDALQGRDIGQSFRERGKEAALGALVGEPSGQATPKRRRSAKLKQRTSVPSSQIKSSRGRKRRRGNNLSRAALNRDTLF